MAKFRINLDVVVEARTFEDAVRDLASRFGTVASHIGNGVKFADTGAPFQAMRAEDDARVTVDLRADPVRAAQLEGDLPAHGADLDPPAELRPLETQTLTADDVATVKSLLGE